MPWNVTTEVTKPPAVVWNMTLGYEPAGLELLFENSNAVSSFSHTLILEGYKLYFSFRLPIVVEFNLVMLSCLCRMNMIKFENYLYN